MAQNLLCRRSTIIRCKPIAQLFPSNTFFHFFFFSPKQELQESLQGHSTGETVSYVTVQEVTFWLWVLALAEELMLRSDEWACMAEGKWKQRKKERRKAKKEMNWKDKARGMLLRFQGRRWIYFMRHVSIPHWHTFHLKSDLPTTKYFCLYSEQPVSVFSDS